MQSYIAIDLDSLPKEEQADILAFAETVFTNKLFRKVIDPLVFAQLDHAAREAPEMRNVEFARASANGVELVAEEFERLSSLYRERLKKEELFNKYNIT